MERLQHELHDRVYREVRIGAHVPLHGMTIKYFPDSQVPFHQDSAFHTGLIWMSQYVENPFCTKIDLNSRIYQVGNDFSLILAQAAGICFVLVP